MADNFVLVTGAARNIGKGIAARLCQDGYKVIMLDVIEPEDPSIGEFIRCDLSDMTATQAMLDRLVKERRVTRLVNCAGLLDQGKIEETDLSRFEKLYAINVRAPVQIVKALTPGMKAMKFGRIVNIASRSVLGIANLTLYSGTKGALASMTRTWALELAADGITVNAIGPGTTESAMFDEAYPQGSPQRAAYVAGVPMKRPGTPDDIAQATSFFLDERSGYITGQSLYVDGGVSVGRTPL